MPEPTSKVEGKEKEDDQKPVVTGARSANDDVKDSIYEVASQYGAEKEAIEYLRSADEPALTDFQKILLDREKTETKVSERSSGNNEDSNSPEIGLSNKEINKFSFIRAICAQAFPQDPRFREEAAFEFECSRAVEKQMGIRAKGILVPFEVLSRSISVGGTGSNAIATDLMAGSFIELLRKRSALMGLVTPMTGLVGDVSIPSQEGAAQAYWLDEDDEITDSESSLGNRPLTPKTVGAMTEVTRSQLLQSSIDMESFIREDIAKVLALEVDRVGLYGTGSNGQPEGVANMTGINTVDFTGLNPTWSEIVGMETAIASDDADVNDMMYLFGAGMKGHLTTTEKFSGTNGNPIIDRDGTVNGYQKRVTNQVLANEAFFGNWRDLILAMWGTLDMLVDPFTHSKRGRIRVTAFQSMDYIQRHVESFCHGKQFTP